MTDPRIEAAARELKRLFSESEQANDAMWLSCAKCVLDAADAAAWRPIESAPRDGVHILTYYADGRVMADTFPYRGFLEWQEQLDEPPSYWQPLPVPPHTSLEGGGNG